MNVRSVRTAVAREGVLTAGRLAAEFLQTRSVDPLKSSFGSSLGVEFWASYNRRQAELWFDSRSVAEPFEKRRVDPTTVQRRPVYGPFDKLTSIGSVRGGLWDASDSDVADHPTVRGLCERFEEGRAWEDTVYFTDNASAIEAGEVRKGCSSPEELLDVRCAYLDGLFDRIRVDGYQTQDALTGAGIDANRFEMSRDRLLTNEVGVNVGRDGSFLINSGFHRLAIARILRLDEIPVQVIVRHREWQRIRARAARMGKPADERVPSGLQSHPDLIDVLDGIPRAVPT